MLKIVVAVDSFKGCMSTNEVNDAVELGIRDVYDHADVIKVPIADGGEGTVSSMIEGLGGELIEITVHDPLMRPVLATYGILEDRTAIIEMASASGLPLLTESERDPSKTTTYGVGELIGDAINRGCRNFIIGIGGSATNDGGIGMLQALGYQFLDDEHNELLGIGESLAQIHSINDTMRFKKLDECTFRVACDVDNPLFGPNGATYIYAPQKGANKQMIEELDHGLKNLAHIIKEQYAIDCSDIPGAGAAGGLGGGLYAFLNAQLMPGIQIIFEQIRLEDKMKDADFVITGEGKMDEQSAMGKVPVGVANIANKYKIPVIGIAGSVSKEAYTLNNKGLTSIFSILNSPITLNEAMDYQYATDRVRSTVGQLCALIKTFK